MNSTFEYNIHSICRICLEYLGEIKHDLFLVPDLAKKLTVCTLLTVEPQDGFPEKICNSCYIRLNDLHDFHKMCVDSIQKFQDLVSTNSFPTDSKLREFDFFDARVQDPENTRGDTSFDPLLNNKLELLNDQEDVFKMLEKVDKDQEDPDTVYKKEQLSKDYTEEIDFNYSSSSSESDDYNDEDFFPDNNEEKEEEEGKDGKKARDAKSSNEKPKRRRIPKSERKPHTVLECSLCQKKFHKQHRYNAHMKYHNEELPHQCDKCRKGFSTANGLRLHMEHTHSQTSEMHPCPEEGCGKTFSRARILNWHLKKVHNRKKELNERQCFMCGQCDKIFRCPMALKKHRYKHDGKELPYPCNICTKRFVTNSALKDHLMRHAGIKNFVCPYCGAGKTTKQEMQIHINFHTKEKTYPCHLCSHVCMNPQNLKTHIKIVHDKIKNYACQYCGKTFGKAGACRYHEMTHTGEKTCECKVCGKTFIHAKGLAKHLKTHEKRVMRAIEIRNKRSIESGILPSTSNPQQQPQQEVSTALQYENSNNGGLSLPTVSDGQNVSPARPIGLGDLRPDINFYMKEGPYVCQICGQGFNGQGNLKRHTKIVHEGIKDFTCRFCFRKFAKAQTLKHHEMTHTGEKPHECDFCGKRFIQIVALKRHRQVHTRSIQNNVQSTTATADQINKNTVLQKTPDHCNESNSVNKAICPAIPTSTKDCALIQPQQSPHKSVPIDKPVRPTTNAE